MTMPYDVTVIGAGFAGSLLARLLALRGRSVLLVERDAHPRFSLGESSTPLAALSLERLAARYQQPDLRALATHGRWRRELPGIRCGLKRGFTFYRHQPGEPFPTAHADEARMLVSASPDAEVADCQWLRADVDTHLVDRARAAGVDYRDQFEVVAVEPAGERLRLRGCHGGEDAEFDAGFVVDASGVGQVLARAFRVEREDPPAAFSSRLLYGHFEGVRPFAEVAARGGTPLPRGPYPDDWAAVHHLLEEGWMYALRFDDGLVSAGLLIDGASGASAGDDDPGVRWRTVLSRYPALESAFAGARPLSPGVRATGRLQRRRRSAVGERWAMLPQTFAFFDPLFSTGLAWSLLGVERLASVLEDGAPTCQSLGEYDAVLRAEADQQHALLAAAYAARRDFSVFRDVSFLYFACASFEELRQRLLDGSNDVDSPEGPDERASTAWRGFLGARDSDWTALCRQAAAMVHATVADGSDGARQRFSEWVATCIESRNLVGLGESPTHLYGVDTDLLVERGRLLGLTEADVEKRLPRLRGGC